MLTTSYRLLKQNKCKSRPLAQSGLFQCREGEMKQADESQRNEQRKQGLYNWFSRYEPDTESSLYEVRLSTDNESKTDSPER